MAALTYECRDKGIQCPINLCYLNPLTNGTSTTTSKVFVKATIIPIYVLGSSNFLVQMSCMLCNKSINYLKVWHLLPDINYIVFHKVTSL